MNKRMPKGILNGYKRRIGKLSTSELIERKETLEKQIKKYRNSDHQKQLLAVVKDELREREIQG